MALAEMHPSLHFIVQLIEPAEEGGETVTGTEDLGGRITVQRRMPMAAQVVANADVYILRLTTPLKSVPLHRQILVELGAHFDVLRANTLATLILALPLLPEPGAVGPDIEAKARLRDLYRFQLTGQCEMELGALLEMINSVGDSNGRLVVVSRIRSPQSDVVVVGVKYQACLRPHDTRASPMLV